MKSIYEYFYMNAASIAGLTCIPAVVKRNLSEDDAWTYVVETNFRQRSFGELRPSEQAAILSLQYSKIPVLWKRKLLPVAVKAQLRCWKACINASIFAIRQTTVPAPCRSVM